MDHFNRHNGALWAEGVPLAQLAQAVSTPTYVYSRATLERHFQVMDQALDGVEHLVCFAVKSCSNLAVLQVLAAQGSGFDIVSGGELARVLRAGGQAAKVVFSGVGKSDSEIAAALQAGILCFNVESAQEMERIGFLAGQLQIAAPISLRVNPDVDPKTHKYIATGLKTSKFGVSFAEAEALYLQAAAHPHLSIVGIACHIGSQILQVAPFVEAVEKVLTLVERLRAAGIALRHIDVGGGLGIAYRDETPALPSELGQVIVGLARAHGLALLVEPGRVIVGNAGVLLTRVVGTKRNEEKQFVIVDAGMNDLLRPALYDAYHHIELVESPKGRGKAVVDVVGPVCETGDFLALDRKLPELERGDLLAVKGAGAYGFTMASNYNSRPRPAEVLVSGGRYQVVRQRESLEDLWRGESTAELDPSDWPPTAP
jgi:diaminopimelate decarboxylase